MTVILKLLVDGGKLAPGNRCGTITPSDTLKALKEGTALCLVHAGFISLHSQSS